MLAYIPGRPSWQPHFSPLAISDALRDVRGLSIGAANQYIWSAAWAPTRAAYAVALRNLRGLIPRGHRVAAMIAEAQRYGLGADQAT